MVTDMKIERKNERKRKRASTFARAMSEPLVVPHSLFRDFFMLSLYACILYCCAQIYYVDGNGSFVVSRARSRCLVDVCVCVCVQCTTESQYIFHSIVCHTLGSCLSCLVVCCVCVCATEMQHECKTGIKTMS